uniref:Putative ovule protein n=1 Tax=Solanum chacoense TaxID=4108 RepID=A0A0V0HRQ4_SOLCH
MCQVLSNLSNHSAQIVPLCFSETEDIFRLSCKEFREPWQIWPRNKAHIIVIPGTSHSTKNRILSVILDF